MACSPTRDLLNRVWLTHSKVSVEAFTVRFPSLCACDDHMIERSELICLGSLAELLQLLADEGKKSSFRTRSVLRKRWCKRHEAGEDIVSVDRRYAKKGERCWTIRFPYNRLRATWPTLGHRSSRYRLETSQQSIMIDFQFSEQLWLALRKYSHLIIGTLIRQRTDLPVLVHPQCTVRLTDVREIKRERERDEYVAWNAHAFI